MNEQTSNNRAQSDISPEHWGKQVFDHSAVGIAVAELDGRFLTANSAFQRMVGYTEAELRELTALDLAQEADRPATRALLSQLGAGAVRQYQVEDRFRHKDGSLIWVRKTLSLTPAGPRTVGYVVVIAEDITERKLAADELRKQHEILQRIFDQAPLMISFAGHDGRINLVNRQWVRTLGWTLEEIQRRGIDVFAECYPDPRDRRKVLNFIAAAKGEWADFKARGRDGRTLDTTWVEVRLSDGTSFGIGADVTARRKAQEALSESEQRLRQLAEHVVEVLWMVDSKVQRTLYVNPAYERIWGRTCESLYRDTRSFIDAIHPEDRQRFLDAFEARTQSHIRAEIDYRVIRPDGSTRWIRTSSYPVRDAAGEVYRFVGTAEDITEQKRADEHLRRSEAYLAESERLSHIGTWALKIPTREIIFWSQEQYRIHGFDPGKGLPALDAVLAQIHPEDRTALRTINRALSEKEDCDVSYRILLPDGAVRYIHSLGHAVVNQDGEVEFSGRSMDVTERKLAEDALQRSLEQVRALAARVESVREEERTRLARHIHDDLGQAWTGIKMDLSSLLHHPPVRQQERAKRRQAILKLIDDAIDSIRKIATELRPGILDDLGLAAAVEWATGEFAARTGTKCALELPRRDLAIESEAATALFRILQEALTNIARHAEATEFSVRLAEGDGGISLEVRDNGKGFNEAQLAPGGSLGILGMQERALLLGGQLTIRSSPGDGAAVTVWIPGRERAASD